MDLSEIFRKSRPIGEVAELLGELGIKLFPAKEKGANIKAPYTINGVDDATNDVNQIRRFWRRWPNAAIAVPCGSSNGFVVLDLDVKQGKNGIKTLLDYGIDLGDTWAVQTPSGGMHLFYRDPSDFVIKNDVERRLGSGIDVRGDRGYVLWPPSKISTGQYHFITGQEPWEICIDDLPEIICERLRNVSLNPDTSRYRGSSVSRIEMFAVVSEGCRNQELTRRAGYLLHKFGPHQEIVRNWLHELNQKCCDPPLSHREVDRIYKSIQGRELRNRG